LAARAEPRAWRNIWKRNTSVSAASTLEAT
jgi:hypothetical protein